MKILFIGVTMFALAGCSKAVTAPVIIDPEPEPVNPLANGGEAEQIRLYYQDREFCITQDSPRQCMRELGWEDL